MTAVTYDSNAIAQIQVAGVAYSGIQRLNLTGSAVTSASRNASQPDQLDVALTAGSGGGGGGYATIQAAGSAVTQEAILNFTGSAFSVADDSVNMRTNVGIAFGTASGTVCQGNDSRLSDSRAPSGSAGGDVGGTYPTSLTVTNIHFGSDAQGDLALRGASAWGRLAIGTSGQLLRSNGTTAAWTTIVASDVSAIATSARGAASGVASLDGSTLVPIAQIPTGSSSSTVCIGNDSRLSDSRTPTGSAGGDVGGTYPTSLTVTNLTIASQARGDLVYRGASAWVRRAVGTAGQVLTSDGTDPTWSSTISAATTFSAASTALTVNNNAAISGTLTSGGITITGALTSGSGAIALTGNAASSFTTSSGALTLTSAAAATWSTSAGALTLTSAAAATWSTTAGALTLTSAASATWGCSTGTLTLNGSTGCVLQYNGTSVITLTSNSQITFPNNAQLLFTSSSSAGLSCASGATTVRGGLAAGNSGIDVALNTAATRTAGNLVQIQNNGTSRINVPFHGGITMAQGATSSGTAQMLSLTGGAHTSQTASTEINWVDIIPGTVSWATGAITTQRCSRFRAPTLAFTGASTVTDCATLSIDDAPQAGTNATLTRAYALWVQAGGVRFDGASFGVFGAVPVARQTAALPTNNITSGGTTDVYADFTGAVYATDAATIRNNLYQMGQKLIQIDTALRNLGFIT